MSFDSIAGLVLGCVGLLLAGCPGTLEDKERFLVDGAMTGNGGCGDVPTRIFVPSCGGIGCHGVTAPQQGLDLESPGVAARVIGVRAKVCSGLLADPANPDGSLIYGKLLDPPPCGARMPLARPSLSLADIECVKAWIVARPSGGSPGGDGGVSADGGK